MKRKGLRRQLALWAIEGEHMTPDTIKLDRWLTHLRDNPQDLVKYGIRKKTEVTKSDLLVALQLIREDRNRAINDRAFWEFTPMEMRFDTYLDEMHKKGWIG